MRQPVSIIRTPIFRRTPEDYFNIGQKFTVIANPTELEAVRLTTKDIANVPFIDYKNQAGLMKFIEIVSQHNLPVYIRTTAPIEARYIRAISNQMSTIDIEITEVPDNDLYSTLIEAHDKGLNTLAKVYIDGISEADMLEIIYAIDGAVTRIVLISDASESDKVIRMKKRIPYMKSSVGSEIVIWEYGYNFIGLTYRNYEKFNGIFFPEREEYK